MVRTLWLSDMHCGSNAGLTPPDFWKLSRMSEFNQQVWEALSVLLGKIGKVDKIVTMGDLTEGDAVRSGCRDVWSPLAQDQAECAASALKSIREAVGTPECAIHGIKGTSSHTVFGGVDAEELVAEKCGFASLEFEDYFDFEGHVVHAKHNIGGNGMPHTRGNKLSTTNMWNLFEHDIGVAPRAQSFIRGHLHHYEMRGNARYTAMICPCLCGPFGEFGQRKCDGNINMGFMVSESDGEGGMNWTPYLIDLKFAALTARKM